jgi:hypothetical protein
MRMGTKSLLFGSHQFLLHPIMVAIGWRKVYGWWPKGWRTWVAIVTHDWGYWGKANMDGDSGKLHPLWAAARLANWFAPKPTRSEIGTEVFEIKLSSNLFWFWFLAAHSRYSARALGWDPSPLMLPDKLATALLPVPVYAALIWLSGEWVEYADYGRAMGHEVPDGCYGYARWLIDHWRGQFA